MEQQNSAENEAWPWTINVRGKGHYYKTKEAAVAAAKAFRKRGIKSFDVGCMQINMKFHGHEFASLEEAFDPQTNVEYAARFLKRLYDRRQDWMKAATDYHSKNREKLGFTTKTAGSPRNRQKGHAVYTTLYAAAAVPEPVKQKRNWLSRLLWGDDESEKQEVKLSLRS